MSQFLQSGVAFFNSVAGLEWLDQPMSAPCPLLQVSGNEALAQYALFFKAFVQRKKQELVAPNFVGLGEIILPKFSLVHFLPKLAADYGPSTSEALIGNFPGEVFVDFVPKLIPVMGNGRPVAFDVRKAIQSYRASHYTYNWTKNIATVYNKNNVLVVKSYGLANKSWIQRPGMFVGFEKHYNNLNMLMDGVNEESLRGDRKQFLRMDLPINMPGYRELMVDYEKYTRAFKDGLPIPSNPIVRVTKAEGCYWVLDLLGFLLGDYEHSLFNKLTPESRNNLHLVFTANGKALILNVGILQGWLDELNAKPKALKEGELPPPYEPTPKRLNVTKRVYLALMHLTQNGVPVQEILDEEKKDDIQQTGASSEEDADTVDESASGTSARERRSSVDRKEGSIHGALKPVDDRSTAGGIADIFSSDARNNNDVDAGQGETGVHADTSVAGDWTDAVDDKLLEVETTSADIVVDLETFPTPESGIKAALNERARDGLLTVAEHDFFMKKGERYKTIKMENGQTLEEFMQISQADIDDLGGKIEGEFTTIIDESMLRSRATSLKNDYSKKFLLKDIARMVVGIQNTGTAVVDYRTEVISGIEGTYDVIHTQLHNVNGAQGSYHIRLPRVADDGSFTVDGVKQHFQLQRMELPIRKIDEFKVALTSYYDRKLMITRSQKVVDDYGLWMVKQIRAKGVTKPGEKPFLTFSLGSSFNRETVAPRAYSLLAKKFKHIIVTGFGELNFQINDLLEKYPQYKKYTKKESFLIGVRNGLPLWIDDYGNLYEGDVEIDTIENVLGVNTTKAPVEHCVINISGYAFPIGVVLCYYFGIDKLLEITKATTRVVPMGVRPKLNPDEFAIAFTDEYLIFNRREKLPSLIFGGMIKLNNIGNFTRTDLNDRGVWVPLMGDPKVKPQQFKEMKNLFDMFIDPITKDELKRLGYATSFNYLLIDAVKLLETDYTRHEVEIEEQRLVGYERFAGHVYRELVRSMRQYRNKGTERKHVIDINPEAVIMGILTDTSANLVEEVNPIHQLKDQEEVTFGGTGGRSEITMVKRARQQLTTYKGIISEANKDSGKVGFVTYLTSDPRVTDFRGHIDIGAEDTVTGLGSVTANLQYGVGHDDPKRSSFTSTQASQAVSSANYTANILRTGYENVIAHRTSELYSKVAADAGKVTEVADDVLRILYKDGTTDAFPLGLVIGEASGEYHRHTRITDLKVGDTFRKGDVVGWDQQWFARDPFCPGQVAWKAGRMARIAMVEDQDVYEDSIAIAKILAMEAITPYIKVKRFAIDVVQNIDLKVKIGDSVDYDSILCDVEDGHLVDAPAESNLIMDVNRLGVKQVRSNHHGTIVAFDVVYNSPIEDMSESVRKFVTAQDKLRKRKADVVGSDVTKGAVSNSLNVNKPILSPGKAFITIYVESLDPSTNADKYVIGNQMKGTVGSIMRYPLMTEDGREVLVKTSLKGMFNRMVLSFRNKLISCELLIGFTKKAVAVYWGKNK